MVLPGLVAAALMSAACALVACDSEPGKALLHAVYRWRRRRARRQIT